MFIFGLTSEAECYMVRKLYIYKISRPSGQTKYQL